MSDRQDKMISLIQRAAAREIDWDAAQEGFEDLFYRPEYLLPKGVDLDLGPLRAKTYDDDPTRCEHVEMGGAKLGWCKELIIILRAGETPRIKVEGLIKIRPPFPAEEPSDDASATKEDTAV